MNRSLRSLLLPAAVACISFAARLAADTPASAPAATPAVVPAAAPAGAPVATPTPRVITPQLPKALEGIVTQDEFAAFVKFQQGLREDPDIKALNDQIRAKMNEMVDLRKKVQLAQQKAIEAHPDIKAIADKMMKARQKGPLTAPGAAVKPPVAPAPAPAVAPTPAQK